MHTLKLVLLVPALVTSLGCHRRDDDVISSRAVTSATPAPSSPIDHLAEGELVEGKQKAFALFLPRDVTIERTFADEVIAHGEMEPEAVANYVRARVREGTVTVGAMVTTFERVKLPAEPARELRIRVSPGRGYRTTVVVRDITPPVIADPGNETDRWKQAGLLPNGQPLDPKHTQ